MKKTFTVSICLMALALLLGGCGDQAPASNVAAQQREGTPTTTATTCSEQVASPTATATQTAQNQNSTNNKLADGQVNSLPNGNIGISVLSIPQSANNITAQQPAGIVYVENGSHTITTQNGQKQTLNAGQATFLPEGTYTHASSGNDKSNWNFFSVQSQQQNSTPTFSNQKVLYQTPTLPSSSLPQGAYCEALYKLTQQPKGHSSSYERNGVEVLTVTKGSAQVQINGQAPKTLNTGESLYNQPGTPIQITNTGNDANEILSYTVWPQGKPFQQELATPPSVGQGTATPGATASATQSSTPGATASATESSTPGTQATATGTAGSQTTATTTP